MENLRPFPEKVNKPNFLIKWLCPSRRRAYRTYRRALDSYAKGLPTFAMVRESLADLPQQDPEVVEIAAYLDKLDWPGPLKCPQYPYDFTSEYNPRQVEVMTDPESGLPYAMHGGKRLFYPRGYDMARIQYLYSNVALEQDPLSPHLYLTPEFDVPDGAVLFDVGAAEADFSLSVIEKVSRVYIFEVLEEWNEPLRKTFEPWKEKVTILNKYASDAPSETCVTLDSFRETIPSGSDIFFKIDVEGAEDQVLQGAQTLLASPDFNVRAVVCVYHRPDDLERFSALMRSLGYSAEVSRGYIALAIPSGAAPYLRRGLIRCRR